MKFSIPSFNFPAFVTSFEGIAKIATKLGCEVPTFQKVGEKIVNYRDNQGPYTITYFEIEVNGEAPKFDGWSFIATVDHFEGVVLSTGASYPLEYNAARNICDHCNTSRQRNRTFIIERDGEFKQVGGSCLKNYLGHASPEQLAAWFSWLDALASHSCFEPSGRGIHTFDLLDILIKANHFITTVGWVAKSEASEDKTPTAHQVSALFRTDRESADWRSHQFHMLNQKFEKHQESAQKALEWANALEGKNSYELNIKQIAENMFCSSKTFGIAVSMMSGYLRHVEQLERKARELETRLPSNHVGAVKERLKKLDLTVMTVRYFDGAYGTTTQLTMEDSQNNVFIWYASSYIELEKGAKLVLTGTVKEHGEYNGVKQTALTRCKIEE